MQAYETQNGRTGRFGDSSIVRDRAYAEAKKRLAGRKSLAKCLTIRQREHIENDSPFEAMDFNHTVYKND